jgi:hypothetical protein
MNEQPRRSGPHAPLPEAIAASAMPPAPEPEIVKTGAGIAVPEDHMARAARRMAELEEHGSLDDSADKFFIPPNIIPDGWSYEYKQFTVLGKEDPSYQVFLRQKGWEPVPADRHPELMPLGHSGGTILRDGMILMERPLAATEKAKRRDYQTARDQMRQKEEQIGAAPLAAVGRDTPFDNTNKGKPIHIGIKKSYEVGIPDK